MGGYAVIYYGHPRFTGDIDFWVGIDSDNAIKVKKALDDFGYYNENVSAEDFKTPDILYK